VSGTEVREVAANAAAEFFPMQQHGSLPCVKVAGCTVFVYVLDGKLRVSVDLDEAQEYPWPTKWVSGDVQVPMRITVQGETVFSAED